MQKIQKQLAALRLLVTGLVILVMILIGFDIFLFSRANNFKEINAQRINILEKDGRLRMAISNHELQDPGIVGGKRLEKRDRPAGMIFFNDKGDECGGLVYDGDKNSASMTYSVDQYNNDQIMQLQYAQATDNKHLERAYGLKLWDRSDQFTSALLVKQLDSLKALNDTAKLNAGIAKLKASGILGNERMFVGKNKNGEVGLFINDDRGKPRLRIYVDKQNKPVIQALDGDGAPVAAK